jgi:hypothetical protein
MTQPKPDKNHAEVIDCEDETQQKQTTEMINAAVSHLQTIVPAQPFHGGS